MPGAGNPITIRAIASRLRLSAMTVSRALRHAPGVSTATRKLILETAERRGYRPDPALAVLNAYRHGNRHRLTHETIAFLTDLPSALDDSGNAAARCYQGARARAAELGYALELIRLDQPDLTGRRTSQMLQSRGCRGAIVGPLARAEAALDLEWTHFAAITLGRSEAGPTLSAIASNHARNLDLVWQTALARGFRRIGLVLTEADADAVHARHAAQLLQQHRQRVTDLPTLTLSPRDPAAIVAWARAHQPELIVSSDPQPYLALREALGAASRTMRFVHLDVPANGDFAGIDQGHEQIGRQAVTALHSQFLQRGSEQPSRRELILIDGLWKEGRGKWHLPRRR